MKRIILIICCLSAFYATYGQMQLHYWFDSQQELRSPIPITCTNHLYTQIDVSNLAEGIHTLYIMVEDTAGRFSSPLQRQFLRAFSHSDGIYYRCWFDGDEQHSQTGAINDSPIMLDVSRLADGLHTIHIQAYGGFVSTPKSYTFLKVPNIVGNEQLTYVCYIDDELYTQEIVSGNQEIIHIDLDVANLTQGVHKMQIMLAAANGTVTDTYTTYFYRTILQVENEATQLVYVIDGKEQPVISATSTQNGTLHYDLDVSSLSNGLHSINYSLIGRNGVYGTGATQWFYKIPLGGEGITNYEYWLNDDEEHMCHVELAEHVSTYHLISLLPVDKIPIRSSLFHFAYKNDTIPVVYAKNDFHIRFWESGGSFAVAEAQYVDERVCDTVYADTLKASNIISMPQKDSIYWYCVQAKQGDSIAIKTNKACELQIFSPSAEEVYRADAINSLKWGGCHAKQAGVYYVAMHDYKSDSLPSITLYSQHIDRYAVLGQDANKVGNGGFSTITYEGNGFDSLKAVYLINTNGDTIHSRPINHDSHVRVSIVFDFTDVMLGEYDAVFEFAGNEEVYLEENIIIEEPLDIVLTSSIDYPSTYLQGETVTYELTITNEGNMTAYDVPIYIYIASNTFDGISQIELRGLNLPSLMEYIPLDSLSEKDVLEAKRIVAALSNDHYFLKFKTTDEETGDSIIVRSNYFFTHIAPYETKKIELQLTATDNVNVWFTVPNEYIPYVVNKHSTSFKRIKASAIDSYCCIRERIECVTNFIAELSDYLPGPWKPIIGCVTSTLTNLSSTVGHWRCLQEGFDEDYGDLDEAKNTISISNLVLDCGKKLLPYKELELLKILVGVNKKIAIADAITSCVVAFTQSKPNCPPGNHEGGESRPVDPCDPNEIRGYISESGSKYIRQEIETIHYEIEFENDTAVATAPAHTIIIRDTLNANYFDLKSFNVTEICIGDKKMIWTTGQNGTQTLDMRTRMNVIAQVTLDYDIEKGIAIWTITSLDPMTMEPISDADLGVLPINFDGNGKGTISYRVRLKNKFADGIQISNRASIIFDNNDPIATPTWVNIVDAFKPTSAIVTTQLDADSITFQLETSDNRSDVWRREVYARVNATDEWQIAAQSYTDTVVVKLTNGWRDFYVLAIDSAGNIESKVANPEYSLVLETYLITFYDEDGVTVLDEREWDCGVIPYCEAPTKPADEDNTYLFNGWFPDIIPVLGEASYRATYKKIPNVVIRVEEAVTACDSYTWNGVTYTESGDYTYTTVAVNGCDSIVTLHLTINETQYAEETVTACDSYEWNGQTYATTGAHTYTTVATNGCDSIVTLHLTINQTQYAEESVTACDTYVWNGETYTVSGEYVYTTTAKNGCDSIVTLHLTINQTQYAEESVVACDNYVWNGETYTQSGEYVYTTTAVNGCDSIVTLHLTINQTQYAEESVVACDSYTWNGETYTQSGEYIYTTTAKNGCDSIVTLHLTINYSEYEEYTAVACDEYIWNGVIYTESGDYTYTTTTAADCERVEVLHLTINKSEHVEFTETACDSYVWNGATYTESGDYTYTTTTAAGCERVETLHLTINKSEHIEETVTACDSYEWNGLVYTESGDYTYTTTTEQGCERVEVLHLTILPEATTESETLVLCPSELPYEWHGQSITEAGTYSATEQYAGMECDSIIHELTLNVYVQTLPVAVTLPIVRTGEAIDVTIPTAEIQAHIAADTWYAPDALIAWYILDNSNWATLTDEPVSSGINEVVMKYAVDSDCGSVESDRIIIPVETTGVENIPTDEIGVYKVVRDNQIFIIRGGNIYSIVGHIIKD